MADDFNQEFFLSQEKLDEMLSSFKSTAEPVESNGEEEEEEVIKERSVSVKKIDFKELTEAAELDSESINFDVLHNVQAEVRVVLAKTKKEVGEILEIRPGSNVPLEKMAGEPAEVYIEGKLFARGEIGVIDDTHYGVLLTEFVSPKERLKNKPK